MRSSRWWSWILALALASCADAPRTAAPALTAAGPARARPTEPVSSAPRAPSHEGSGELTALAVPGFGDAVLVAPAASRALPLFCAAHGAGDGPDAECGFWAPRLDGRFVLVCPRGRALGKNQSGYYFENHLALEREVLAVVARARETLGPRLATAGGVYAAYSQGATMGALMLPEHGDLFSRLLLIEGGSGEFTLASARRLRATGGERVAIVCGTSPCARRARRTAALLERAGLGARAEYVPGGGHAYWGAVGERALAVLSDWLLQP